MRNIRRRAKGFLSMIRERSTRGRCTHRPNTLSAQERQIYRVISCPFSDSELSFSAATTVSLVTCVYSTRLILTWDRSRIHTKSWVQVENRIYIDQHFCVHVALVTIIWRCVTQDHEGQRNDGKGPAAWIVTLHRKHWLPSSSVIPCLLSSIFHNSKTQTSSSEVYSLPYFPESKQ